MSEQTHPIGSGWPKPVASNEEAGEAADPAEVLAALKTAADLLYQWLEGTSTSAGPGVAVRTEEFLASITAPAPTVNGTDEPPNAIVATVIPSDAGRTDMDYEEKAAAVAAEILTALEHRKSGISRFIKNKIWAALRDAGGRVELVERPADRPVTWRVKDYADGWVLYASEAAALAASKASGAVVQALYARTLELGE